jgi:hypothetical protein
VGVVGGVLLAVLMVMRELAVLAVTRLAEVLG